MTTKELIERNLTYSERKYYDICEYIDRYPSEFVPENLLVERDYLINEVKILRDMLKQYKEV